MPTDKGGAVECYAAELESLSPLEQIPVAHQAFCIAPLIGSPIISVVDACSSMRATHYIYVLQSTTTAEW